MGEVEGLIWLFGVLAMLQVKLWSTREASYRPAFMSNYYSHVFSLIRLVDEFSFKELRTWGQFKISSGCLCVLCESKELGGRVSCFVLCKKITLGKHLDFFHGSISFSEGKKLINSFHIYEKNSLKIFRSLNSIALIDQSKA